MANTGNPSELCELCQRIFRGHWQAREDSVLSDSTNEEDDDAQFYERPDWLQVEGVAEPGVDLTTRKPKSPAHHNIPAIEVSANNGCHLCAVIWDQLQSKLPELTERWGDDLKCAVGIVVARPSFDTTDDRDLRSGPEPVDLEFVYFLNGKCEAQDAYIVTTGIDLQPATAYIERIDAIQSNTTEPAPSVVRHIQDWTLNCIRNHTNCTIRSVALTKIPQVRKLPTRFLDVSLDQGDGFIRLQESHIINPETEYMTLSHCWGLSLPVRLLLATYQQFCDRIPISTLPKTFQNAIHFVRTLRVRFLWIDALCIIQDSKDDWLRESLRMASIYTFSFLNVAATSSADGHGGLYKSRNRLLATPCQIDALWTGHTPGTYLCLDQSAWARYVEGGHLNTRGWVLQERLLAPRNVHFAYDQIWWECRKMRACEAFPKGTPEYVLDLETEKVKLLVDLDANDPLTANVRWLGIVKIYTQACLTKDSDRLIALAGIASTVQNVLGWATNDYLAGLWRCDILVDLLWRMAAYGTRVKEYVAPSWSWASVKGEVYFHGSENRGVLRKANLIDIIHADTYPRGGPFGPVSSGSIQLRAWLYPMCLDGVEDSTNGRHFTKLQIDGLPFLEDGFAESLDDEDLYEHGLTNSLEAYFCRFVTSETPHLDEKYSSEGLILGEIDGGQAIYQRMGWMRIFHQESEEPYQGPQSAETRSTFRIV